MNKANVQDIKEMTSEQKTTSVMLFPKQSTPIKVGEIKPQAPAGNYLARCVHVEPNWTYFRNKKIALYFEVAEGPNKGMTARRFYQLKLKQDGSVEIRPRSKFMDDVKKLFPDKANAEEIDPVSLFAGKHFDIVVIEKPTKDKKLSNSLAIEINHHDPGW